MEDFEVQFKFYGGYEKFEKLGKEIIERGINKGDSHELIITKCLEEYEVWMFYRRNEIFQATVNFEVFLLDLTALAFYAVLSDIPREVDFNGMMLKNVHDIPEWLTEDVEILKEILKGRPEILTLTPVFYSVFGSYDPTVPMFAFKKIDTLYLISIPYKQVAELETEIFAGYVAGIVKTALGELSGYIPLFEEHGISEYTSLINDVEEAWKLLSRRILKEP
ncbi:hypothetical protein [Thermococcus thioreducens]|uniref:Uncharacterized protein n=1 Tax=Thermococcus thioreducens TaxID=277988 RepID=A0A0Q2XMM9_9EURY|nr:hypothetical protein [Thermococcus thioreducens]ASJ12471.1 hypothetical protein A3L14_06010 [Thermococcus thioreducens]KQH82524.1 hypothetical protein AMR53_06235 [Thermococcus thioreducens]SEV90207.1 hypothetical protein SAMN05216170_0753 [Thermococcus thioreducens]